MVVGISSSKTKKNDTADYYEDDDKHYDDENFELLDV
jgi:hypothetical protein